AKGAKPYVLTLAVGLMLPDDVEVPTPPADAPATSPATPRTAPKDELHNCILAIKADRPNDPPSDQELWVLVGTRLGPVARDVVLAARKEVAPKWVDPVGRPRKSAQ